MNMLLLNVLLALAWAALAGDFEPVNLLFGFLLGYLVMWIFSPLWGSRRYFRQVPRLLDLTVFFLLDMIRANLRLTAIILSPQMKLRPAVVAVPLELHNGAAIILLTSLITLTPGTFSLDVSSDRRMLYVHTIWLEDADNFRRQVLDGYERRIKELFEE